MLSLFYVFKLVMAYNPDHYRCGWIPLWQDKQLQHTPRCQEKAYTRLLSLIPARHQAFQLFAIPTKPRRCNNFKLFLWKIFFKPRDLCFRLIVHEAFDLYPVMGEILIDNLEIWLVRNASTSNWLEPKFLGLILPVLYVFYLPEPF